MGLIDLVRSSRGKGLEDPELRKPNPVNDLGAWRLNGRSRSQLKKDSRRR